MSRVLISGASIAGPALAFWLRRAGWDAATTGEEGTEFIGRSGQVVAAFPAGTSDSGGATPPPDPRTFTFT